MDACDNPAIPEIIPVWIDGEGPTVACTFEGGTDTRVKDTGASVLQDMDFFTTHGKLRSTSGGDGASLFVGN